MATLIVLGNGFDLACGLKTRYSDFFEYEKANNGSFSSFSRALVSLDMNQFTIWEQDPFGEVRKLPPLSDEFSVWEAMFSILEWKGGVSSILDRSWCDVESVISDSLDPSNPYALFKWPAEYAFLDELDKYGKMVDSLIGGAGDREWIMGYYLYSQDKFVSFFKSRGFSEDSFYLFLFSELSTLEKRFSDYILLQENSSPDYKSKSNRLFLALSNGENCCVDSFNFTSPPLGTETRYLHGNASSRQVIFGVLERENAPEFEYRFTKPSRQCDLLSHGIGIPRKHDRYDRVVIYGHSLGNQDYDYFFTLFDQIGLARSEPPVLDFAFSVYDNNHEFAIRDLHRSSVTSLLRAYANSRKLGLGFVERLLGGGILRFSEIPLARRG